MSSVPTSVQDTETGQPNLGLSAQQQAELITTTLFLYVKPFLKFTPGHRSTVYFGQKVCFAIFNYNTRFIFYIKFTGNKSVK